MAGTPTRRAPYKDTLQPALHRRFSSTAGLLLAVSYLESILLSSWESCKETPLRPLPTILLSLSNWKRIYKTLQISGLGFR